jgi:hypothetical protein
MMDFLAKADRHKGAWSHWINGETGKTVPFGKKDNGGDLVETAFLTSGILMVREYFKNGNKKKKLWPKNVTNFGKESNGTGTQRGRKFLLALVTRLSVGNELSVEGYNECLITYILAASSPTYLLMLKPITKAGQETEPTFQIKKIRFPLYVKHNGAEEYGGLYFGRIIPTSV